MSNRVKFFDSEFQVKYISTKHLIILTCIKNLDMIMYESGEIFLNCHDGQDQNPYLLYVKVLALNNYVHLDGSLQISF